ncbi:hypothetical protein [Cohnella nanjingensis]|uniref:Uncharacterized protein n=1 Tax=Cohnella nanjingensis TaxID=1387779 RepID=A0A7X0RV33_9BACL|nr:hypothetical protein [Cohnella nanjingensis]MBB6674091.1 hypothetical protein [Cohnella nanjingensis]
MKLRIVPITAAAALSAAVLFGGWFAYRHFGVEQPLDRVAQKVPGVESAQASMKSDQVVLTVKLNKDADLAEVYRQVKADGAQAIGSKELQLVARNSDDPALEKVWRSALFDVAEAMDHRKYTGIRDAMIKLEQATPGLTASSEMDEQNVYISLHLGDHAKYVILPRDPAKLGVWPNA